MNDGVDAIKLLQEGKIIQIKPQGYSMYPMFLPKRDSAILAKADQSRIKRGDVVLYRRDSGTLVLHRIWKVTKEGVFLVGDNQVEIEGPLKKEQIKGILKSFIWKGMSVSTHNPIYLLLSRGWLLLRPFRNIIKRVVVGIFKLNSSTRGYFK